MAGRATPAPPLQLAEGIDLIGEFEGSGYKEPHYIARRADGQVIQLSELLYRTADNVDGSRGYKAIADEVSQEFGRRVSEGNVQFLIEKKLRPLGVVKGADGSEPDVKKLDPFLALKFRTAVVPDWLTKTFTTIFKPLFWPPVIIAAVIALGALDYWLFAVHGIAQGARTMLYEPTFLLAVFGLVVVSAAFHEIGHATAVRYGGAKPGVMGVGIYLVWPAFYTDVTDAYRLGRGGRLRTDLGGIYFNGIFSLVTFGAYFLTGWEPLLFVIVLQHMEVLHQLLPFLRLDGYYIIADLTGVPDMFARIKPILKSAMPFSRTDDSVKELKPWVRMVVTLWVLALIPILLYVFGIMIISAPRLMATAWDSLVVQWGKTSTAFGDGQYAGVAAGGLQMGALSLPIAGMVASFGRLGKKITGSMWKRTDGRPIARGSFVIVALGLLAAVA